MTVGNPSRSVPKLRFPEFRDAGEWEPRKLGEIADFFKGKGLPKSMLSNDGKSKCIHYGELFTAYPEVIRTVHSRTDLDENLFLSAEDDVLMPTSDVTPNGLAKACCVKLRDVIIGGDVLVVRTDQQRVDGEFLARYIRRLEQKVLQLVTGTTVYHLYANSLEKLDLCVPKKPEQRKIADCLGSLDDLIAAEGRMLDALRHHKQGLMQQLFPQPGETVPKLRFPEFRDAGEWEPRKLGEIADFFKGKGLPKSMLSNDGKSKCIHYGELFTAYPEVIRTVHSRTDLDENLFLSAEDDVLMPTSDVTPNGLAKACCVKLRDVIIGGDVLVVRTDQQRVDGEFLARYIRRLEQKVLQLVTGTTVYHLYANSLEKLDLCVPKKPEVSGRRLSAGIWG